MIQLYKPTKKNTGAALGFQASDRDKNLYVTMIKQVSWDETRQTGSFNENRSKPGFYTTIKFNQIEAAAIIDAIEQASKFSTYHKSAKSTTQIVFAPGDAQYGGFTLAISQTNNENTAQKNSFFIPISFPEARLIKEYLVHYLHKSFKFRAQKKTEEQQPDAAPASEEQSDAAPAEAPVSQPAQDATHW